MREINEGNRELNREIKRGKTREINKEKK